MIRKPVLGRLTQGSIFCGAVAEGYENVPVWGLVITARCDAAHDKTHIFNYLPVVRVDDWLRHDGGMVVAHRALADQTGRFINLLAQRDLSSSLLDVHSPSDIAQVHFRGNSGKSSRDDARVQECAFEIERLRKLFEPALSRSDMGECLKGYRKLVQSVLNELLGHRLGGYYFLPEIGGLTEWSSKLGYVVLLREVHHLSRNVVSQLIEGIVSDGSNVHNVPPGLCLSVFDFAYPIAEMQSPWTEHLLQAFCNLFGRIGVDDHDRERVASIVSAVAPE